MTEDRPKTSSTKRPSVRLPGFIKDETGLGDVVRKVTYAFGIKPCGGCDKRAAVLNRWMVFRK